MKWLVLLLVLANGAFLLYWHTLQPVQISERSGPALASVAPARILLAQERPAPTPQCQSLGPINNREILAAVNHWLGDAYGALTEREVNVAAAPVFRVQVQTPSADLATRLAQRVRSGGDGAVAVLPPEPGETTVVVALGLFADRSNADRRVLELHRHGVDAGILTIERHTSQWWIDFTAVATPNHAALIGAVSGTAAVTIVPCELMLPHEEEPAVTNPAPLPVPNGIPMPKLGADSGKRATV